MSPDRLTDPPVSVEETDVDACIIRVDIEPYEWAFAVQRLNIRRGDVLSLVSVSWVTSGSTPAAQLGIPTRPLPAQNINWRSHSALADFCRRLETYYGKDLLPWKVLVEWVGGAVEAFTKRPTVFEKPQWAENTEATYLLKPFIPTGGVTIFFGPGDSGKGYLTLACLFVLCGEGREDWRLQDDGGQGLIYYLDYEDSFLEWSKRLTRLAQGMATDIPDGLRRIPGRGIPFADQADSLQAQMAGEPLPPRLIVIDSAMPAAGGDIIRETEPVRLFFAAAARFPCPILLIAHETKSEDDTYPFGSIFWHNLARWTVNVRGAIHQRGEHHIFIRHRKHNAGPRFGNRAYRLLFSDDDAGEVPTFTKFEAMELRSLTAELQEKRSVQERLADLLRNKSDGGKAKELAEDLGISADTVRKTLARSDWFISEGGGKGSGNEATWWVRQ